MEDFEEQLTRAFDLRGLQEDTRRSYTGYERVTLRGSASSMAADIRRS